MNDQRNLDEMDAQYIPKEDHSAFQELLDAYGSELQDAKAEVGDRVRGTILEIGEQFAFVDFGGRSEAVIEVQELMDDEGEPKYAVGDEIEAYVASIEEEPRLTFSIRSAAKSPELMEQAYLAGIPVEGQVTGVNQGGFEVNLKGMQGFCPISQIDLGYCEDPDPFVGQTLTFRILEYRAGGRTLVLSRRRHLEEEEKQRVAELRARLEVGAELEGTVTRIQPFGAFVDLGGVEGLVHISELSYGRVRNPREAVTEGAEVKVKVIEVRNVGEEGERISLSIKATQPDPWEDVPTRFPGGSVVTGPVVSVQDFGVFVSLAPGVEGLIHVSELSEKRVRHPRDTVTIGQEVSARVLHIDTEQKRISLSMKAIEGDVSAREVEEYRTRRKVSESEEGSLTEALRRAGLV